MGDYEFENLSDEIRDLPDEQIVAFIDKANAWDEKNVLEAVNYLAYRYDVAVKDEDGEWRSGDEIMNDIKKCLKISGTEDIKLKVLKNSFDHEIEFYKLDKAKKYYLPSKDEIEDIKEEQGEEYAAKYIEYCEKIKTAKSLDELAEVLTSNSDTYENGSQWYVKEY